MTPEEALLKSLTWSFAEAVFLSVSAGFLAYALPGLIRCVVRSEIPARLFANLNLWLMRLPYRPAKWAAQLSWQLCIWCDQRRRVRVAAKSQDTERRIWAISELSRVTDSRNAKSVMRLLEAIRAEPDIARSVREAATASLNSIHAQRKYSAKEELQEGFREEVRIEVNRILRGSSLTNYAGYVCASFIAGNGVLCRVDECGEARTNACQKSELRLWFQPTEPGAVACNRIIVEDGVDSDDVVFEVALDTDLRDVNLAPQRLTFAQKNTSPIVSFPIASPTKPGKYPIWASVLQENRTIQILKVTLVVIEESDGEQPTAGQNHDKN